jgi:hypothetical protein
VWYRRVVFTGLGQNTVVRRYRIVWPRQVNIILLDFCIKETLLYPYGLFLWWRTGLVVEGPVGRWNAS